MSHGKHACSARNRQLARLVGKPRAAGSTRACHSTTFETCSESELAKAVQGTTISRMATIRSWARIEPLVRGAALLVAIFTVGVGVVGLVSPDSVTAARRQYFATPTGLYTAGAVRLAMGLVVILSATASRAPKTLRLLGALMCMQGISATLLGPEHARTVLEWETMRPALLRAGAIVALVSGVFMAFVVTGRPTESNAAIP